MSTQLTRFDPFMELANFDSLRSIEDIFRDFRLKQVLRDAAAPAPIRVDVSETDKAYTVKAEMPGVNKEDINVDLDGNRVSIAVETKREAEKKDGSNVVRAERYVGKSFRSFTLDHEVDNAASQATYRDGVLELILAKRPNGKGSEKLTIN